MKKNLKWIICILSVIIFLILACLVCIKKELTIDNIVIDFILKIRNENLTNIIKLITHLGSATMVILIPILSLLILKNKKISLFMSLNLILITACQHIIKPIIGRTRPSYGLIKETSFSFPSGHSLTSMAFYGFIIYLIYKSNLKYKKLLITLLSILIILIGFSRLYLGVHYVTDVLGGFIFSLFYLIIYIHIIKDKI